MSTEFATDSAWVIYSTYEKQGRAPGFIADQLSAYQRQGLKILVVDTSPFLLDERRALWERYAEAWLQRENVGYDFHSFRVGLSWIMAHTDTPSSRFSLLLTNDSCYGPFRDLAPIFARLRLGQDENCVYGMTESRELRYHLQSYWLYFQPQTIETLAQFFAALPEFKDRHEAIRQGELVLTEHLKKSGVQLKVIYPLESILKRYVKQQKWAFIAELAVRRIFKRYRFNWWFDRQCLNYLLGKQKSLPDVNPMIMFGVDLVRDEEVPFMKRQLLRENPHYDPRISAIINAQQRDYFTNQEVLAAVRRH